MVDRDTLADSFTEFVRGVEPRLRQALCAAFGGDHGREATADALAFGWEHWDRIRRMDNPAGYLWGVGRNHPSLDAAVWTSVDGITWSRVPHEESVFGGLENPAMLDVTAGGPGLVAVGYESGGAVVWISVDGTTWSRVSPDETISGGTMTAVIAGGPGLVAVGNGWRPGTNEKGRALVWTSMDGFTWSRVPHDEEVFSGPNERSMESVTVGGPGLVAVGNADWDAVVWVWED